MAPKGARWPEAAQDRKALGNETASLRRSCYRHVAAAGGASPAFVSCMPSSPLRVPWRLAPVFLMAAAAHPPSVVQHSLLSRLMRARRAPSPDTGCGRVSGCADDLRLASYTTVAAREGSPDRHGWKISGTSSLCSVSVPFLLSLVPWFRVRLSPAHTHPRSSASHAHCHLLRAASRAATTHCARPHLVRLRRWCSRGLRRTANLRKSARRRPW